MVSKLEGALKRNGKNKGSILLAAGGTGGHLFPAEALAHELNARGYSIELATDLRARKFADDFPAKNIHVIKSATMGGKNPIALVKTAWALFAGYRQCKAIIKNTSPLVAVGFGGYPTLPPILAAVRSGIPTLLHEQNAVLGRANRFLAKYSKGVAVGFKQVGALPSVVLVETGNPIRPMVDSVLDTPYPKRKANGKFRLVVFGGSQGASIFSEVVPQALELLPKTVRAKISILQQSRVEDEAELKSKYETLGIKAEISPFFKNMPAEIAGAHLVIARAGASSITELAVIGRPSFLVPYPGSLDGDQANNAIAMREAGGAKVVKQSDLTPQDLTDFVEKSINEPQFLVEMGAAAKKTGISDAASRLADCVECVIGGGNISSL